MTATATANATATATDPTRWIRLQDAADRLGIRPSLLLAAIRAGQAPIRVVTLGQRGLIHVSDADFERYRHRLSYQTIE